MMNWNGVEVFADRYKVLSQHLLKETDENHKSTFMRRGELVAENQTQHFPVHSSNTNHLTIMYGQIVVH
jgi:hypothetical protein